jgi:hypothetical protein
MEELPGKIMGDDKTKRKPDSGAGMVEVVKCHHPKNTDVASAGFANFDYA